MERQQSTRGQVASDHGKSEPVVVILQKLITLFKRDKPQDAIVQDTHVTKTKPIVMYSTRFCPYCIRARSLLGSKGWAFEDIAVDSEPGLRQEMIQKSGRHTVPQIWIGDQHIGGCDELVGLEMSGQLDQLALGEH